MKTQLFKNKFIYPKLGILGQIINSLVANKSLIKFRRFIFGLFPFLKLESDVKNVVYLNWVIDCSVVEHLVPKGVHLWEKNGKTIFTILTYEHRHFGPSFLGSLRYLFPSPFQSNWRLYVDKVNEVKKEKQVLFVKNIMDNKLYSVGTRLFSDALPTHCALSLRHKKINDEYITEICSGNGSSPEIYYKAKDLDNISLPLDFYSLFSSWSLAISFLCLQDSAITDVECENILAEAGIDIPIDLNTVTALQLDEASFKSQWLRTIISNQLPFCFVVPKVKFKVLWERII